VKKAGKGRVDRPTAVERDPRDYDAFFYPFLVASRRSTHGRITQSLSVHKIDGYPRGCVGRGARQMRAQPHREW